ncbi:adenosylcobinamide-GDP ribazoletransferase [Albidovulum sp.]|uniref:adenosylcobinamide-GDP ribazoletransferase n=1 Tax=Albidovulum sp. TaxID=1872424 RepID=UPI0039B83E00
MSGGRADELRLAFLLLTRLPVRPIPGEAPAMAASSWAWPIVGLVVGGISALVCLLALALGLPPAMAAILALAAAVLVTGGMHEDGLADLADGFGGGRTRERKLEIMRDSRIGSYGVIALVLALGFRATAIVALIGGGGSVFTLAALAAGSRAVLPAAIALMPAARGDGLGRAAAGIDPVPARAAAAIGFLCLMPLGIGTAVVTAAAIAFAALVVARLAMRQIGGQTGDVLGAMQHLAECAGWAAAIAIVV